MKKLCSGLGGFIRKRLYAVIVMAVAFTSLWGQPVEGQTPTQNKTQSYIIEYYPNGAIITPIPIKHTARKLYNSELTNKLRMRWTKVGIVEQAKKAAINHAIPPKLFLALIRQESNFNIHAVSTKGAIGLTQLMPGTAKFLRVNPKIPQQNIDGGARYLAQQYKRFKSWELALAAYNAGPEAVVRYNGIPPYRETQWYVSGILKDWRSQLVTGGYNLTVSRGKERFKLYGK